MAFFENRDDISKTGIRLAAGKMLDYSYGAHWHNELEVVMVKKGEVQMGIDSEKRLLKEGDIAVCTSGQIHYYESLSDSSATLLFVFHPELLQGCTPASPFRDPFLTSTAQRESGIPPVVMGRIYDCLYVLYDELEQKGDNYQSIIKGRLTELMGLLLRYLPQRSFWLDARHAGGGSIALMQKAISYIEQNYAEDISLESLADYLGISLFYLSKIFVKVTGRSYKSFLNYIRIQHAEELIMNTDRTIIDIAFACGFNSARTFNRVYKMLKGDIPSSIRKSDDDPSDG